MPKKKKQNKFNELAVKQNLLLWQLSKSYLEAEKKLMASIEKTSLE